MELSLSDGVWWFGHYPSEWRIGYLALLKIPVESLSHNLSVRNFLLKQQCQLVNPFLIVRDVVYLKVFDT